MGRTKGATNKKSSNTTVVKANTETKETKPRGRQKGQVIERESSIVIDLDSNYRIKWDKLNKQLQVKMEKSANQNPDEIEDVEDGFKTLGYFQSWQGLGKRYIDELTRKSVLRKSKDGITDINSLIDVVNRIENKVVKLFGGLEVNEERIKVQ